MGGEEREERWEAESLGYKVWFLYSCVPCFELNVTPTMELALGQEPEHAAPPGPCWSRNNHTHTSRAASCVGQVVL